MTAQPATQTTCWECTISFSGTTIKFCPLHAQAEALREALEAIRDYEPNEVAYDDFAYNRMVENYRAAARAAMAQTSQAVDTSAQGLKALLGGALERDSGK